MDKLEIKNEIIKIRNYLLLCREYNAIIKAINNSSNGFTFNWIIEIKDCLLFKIWNILYDIYSVNSKNICSFNNILSNIEKSEINFEDKFTKKKYLIKKKEVEEEIQEIRLSINSITSFVKHKYINKIYEQKLKEYKEISKNINKKWFDRQIDQTELIFWKIAVLFDEKITPTLFVEYNDKDEVEFISKYLKLCQPK